MKAQHYKLGQWDSFVKKRLIHPTGKSQTFESRNEMNTTNLRDGGVSFINGIWLADSDLPKFLMGDPLIRSL